MMAAGGIVNPCPPGKVPDGKGNCVDDLTTPPIPSSSLYPYYTDQLAKAKANPKITNPDALVGQMIRAKKAGLCKSGECWKEEEKITKVPPEPGPKEHYTIKDSGNPGHSYLWKYTDDGNSGYNQALIGSVFNRDFLNDEQQVQFDAPGGGTAVVNYDPNIQKVYSDQRDVWQTIEDERGVKQNAQNNLNREQQRIKEENAARELWEKQQREKQNKRIAPPKDVAIPPGGFAMGGELDHGKVAGRSRTKANNNNYVLNQTFYEDGFIDNNSRRTLKGFITGAPKPGEPGTPAKLANGGTKMIKIKSLPKAQSGPSSSGLTPEQQQNYEDRYLVYRDQGDSTKDANNLAFNDASYFNTDPVLNFQSFLPNPDSGVRVASGKRFPLEYIDWNTYKPFDEAMYDPYFTESYHRADPELQGKMKDQVESDYTYENYYNSLDDVKAWEKSWYTKRAELPQFTDIANKRLSLIDNVNMQPITKSDFSYMIPGAGAAYTPDKNRVLMPTTSWLRPTTFVHERSHWFDWNAPQNDDMYNRSYFRSYLKPGSIPNPVYNDEDEILTNIIPSEYKLPYGVVDPLRLGENDTNTYSSESEKIIVNRPEASDNVRSAKGIKLPFKGKAEVAGSNNINYYYTPTEIRARLNEWRFDHNIDPTKQYTNEEIQKIIDDDIENKNESNFDFYKIIRGRGDLLKQINDSYVSTGDKENPDEMPKAQRGLATAADSSYVAAGADISHNFYKNNGYDIAIVPNTNSGTFFNLGMDDAQTNKWETGNVFDRLAIARKNYDKLGVGDPNIDVNTNQIIPYSDYTNYKPGTHRFEQRELAIGAMNSKAPRSKYDDRIVPQRMAQYDNWKTGDSATVPVYDKLAVTPWGKLSKSQKLQRLQKFGTSGTPFAGQSTKKALATFKKPSVPPIPDPKMKEASLLPLPKVELKPQLPTILNPYPPKPETEYFIMPSGNPGVGVIHGKTYDGKGGYKEKIIGPSLARDWFNDADQKKFDNNDMSGRIDYDPRDKDPDHKIYADMYSAIQEIDNLRQQEKEARKPKKTPEVRTSKTFKFLTGGSLYKAQDGTYDYFTASKRFNDEKNRIAQMRNNVIPISLSHSASSDNKPFNVKLPEGQHYCTTRACEIEREAGFPINQVASGYKIMKETTPENGWYPTTYDNLLPGDIAQVVRNSGSGHTMVSTGDAYNMPELWYSPADRDPNLPREKGFFWDNGAGTSFDFEVPPSENELAHWMKDVKKMNYYTYKGNLPQYEKEYSSAVNNYLHDTSEGDAGPMAPIDAIPNKQNGGSPYKIQSSLYRAPNIVRQEGREYYDPMSETIYLQPSYPNYSYEQAVKNHEKAHHLQKLKGKYSTTELWPGPLKEPAIGSTDDMIFPYYNRTTEDAYGLMNAVPKSTLFGIPEDIAVMGFQNKTYETPGTAEYEAEQMVHKKQGGAMKKVKIKSLPKAQITGELKEQALQRDWNRQQATAWDPNQLNGAQEIPTDTPVAVRPMTIGLPPKDAPKKSKEETANDAAKKTNKKAQNDATLWLLDHPEYMLDADGNPVLKSSMEANAPAEYLTEQQKALKEEFIRERNAEPLQQTLGTLGNNPQTAGAAERYANTELAALLLEKNPRDKYNTRAEWLESFNPQERAIIQASNKSYKFNPNVWTTFARALQTEGNKDSQWQRNLDLTEEEKNRQITAMDRLGVLSPLMLPAQGVQRVLTEPFSTKNFLTGVVLNNWYNGDTPKPYFGDSGTMRDYYQPEAQAIGNGMYQAIFDPLNYIGAGGGNLLGDARLFNVLDGPISKSINEFSALTPNLKAFAREAEDLRNIQDMFELQQRYGAGMYEIMGNGVLPSNQDDIFRYLADAESGVDRSYLMGLSDDAYLRQQIIGADLRDPNYRVDQNLLRGWLAEDARINNRVMPPPSEITFDNANGFAQTYANPFNQQEIIDLTRRSGSSAAPSLRERLMGMVTDRVRGLRRVAGDDVPISQVRNNFINYKASNPEGPVNKSLLGKNETKALLKDKSEIDKLEKLSDSEFRDILITPDGKIKFPEKYTGPKQITKVETKDWVDEFNGNLELLNRIIAENNTSGKEYWVTGITEDGVLQFRTAEGRTSSMHTYITPGKFRGEIQDIADTKYMVDEIPGLQMAGASPIFGNAVRGTGTYKSLNEYLKKLDLGRVKSGMNSQSPFSRPLWENAIKKGDAFGFYASPSTVYGIMKKEGGVKKKKPGFQVLTDANGKYVFVKT
jgi:hypothetical protein